MALFNILVDIAAKTANFESGIDRIDKRLEKWGDNVKRIGEFVAASAFAELTKKVIENGDRLLTLSQRANTTGQAFSELAYTFKLSGVSQDELAKALTQMNRALSLAATGSKDQRDALAALGLTTKDFIGLETDKKFELIADRISKLTDAGDKTRAEMVLLGRAGADLGPAFQKGADGLRAAREEARQVGASFTEAQLKTLEEANKSIERMSAAWDGLATRLVSKVAPSLESIFDKITALVSGDKLLKLREQLEFLKEDPSESFFAVGYGDIGTGFFSANARQRMIKEFEERLRIAEQGRQTHSRGSISSGSDQNFTGDLPGFLSDIEPFTISAQKAIVGGRAGINPVLQQWDQDTKASLDSVYEQYRLFKEHTLNLLDEKIIDPTEAAKRLEEAWGKFENESFISPVVISQRTVSLAKYLTEAQRQVHEFVGDFKSSLQSAFDQGGSVGKNFVRNLIKALSDRALYQAIASIGDALAASLNKASTAGQFGGFLGQILGSIFGGSGEISPVVVTQSKVPTYASGTNYVPRTGLALIHQGEAVIPAAQNAGGGGGVTLAPVYNIDARGATTDLIQALPEILRRNNDALKDDIVQGYLRKKYPLPPR
jgi:hypothetical protein